MSIVAPITAGSAKQPGWPFREAHKKGNRKRGPMQRVDYLIHCMRTETWKEASDFNYFLLVQGL